MTDPARIPAPRPGRRTLLAVIGSIGAATALFTQTPLEESGRTVEARVAADGTATLRHVAGRQYLAAYRDIVGVVTICDGDTADVRIGQVATPAECTARLERQLIAHAEGVIACVPKLYGREHQVTGAVLLAYNIGVGAFCRSTAARLMNGGKWRDAADAMLSWNKTTVPASAVPAYRRRGETCVKKASGGWHCSVKGLSARRKREREIFLKGLPL